MTTYRKATAYVACAVLAFLASADELDAQIEDGICALMKAAEYDDYEARTYASRALRRVGPAAVEPLTGLLKHENDKVGELAASALGGMKVDAIEAIPHLLAMLDDRNPEVRGHAALALGGIGQEPDVCIPALFSLLADEEDYPSGMALQALRGFESQRSLIIDHLKRGVESEDAKIRRRSVGGLGQYVKFDEEIVPIAMRALEDPDSGVRRSALFCLKFAGSMAHPSIPVFLGMLKEDEPEVRRAAAHALYVVKSPFDRDTSPDESKVIAALLDAMMEDEEVCKDAAVTLHNMGLAAHQALATALGSENTFTQLAAAQVLSNRTQYSDVAKPQLVDALDSENQQLRWYAALGLSHLSDPPGAVIDILKDILEQKDKSHDQLRYRVPWASFNFGRAGLPCLAIAAQDPVWYIRRDTLQFLGRMEESEDEIIPLIVAGLQDADSAVRIAAIETLGSKDNRAHKVVTELEAMLKDPDQRVRLTAADVLSRMDTGTFAETAIATLTALLESEDAYIRLTAASKLAHLAREVDAIMPVLVDGLRHRQRAGESPSDILAAETLGVVGTKPAESEEVLALLRKLLDDRDSSARTTAVNTLVKIAPDREWLVPALIDRLGKGDEVERSNVIQALARIGSGAKAAVPILEEICRTEVRLRSVANEALDMILAEDVAKYRSELPGLVVSILQGLGSDDMDVGGPAYYNLVGMGQEAVPYLIRALREKRYRLRSKAAGALATIGADVTETAEAVPYLVELAGDCMPYARQNAIAALAAIDAPAETALPVYIAALHDDTYWVFEAAIKALAEMGPKAKPALPALVDAMKQNGRASPCDHAILRIGPDATLVPELIQTMIEGKPGTLDGTRPSAARVLKHLGSAAKDAVPNLVTMLRDDADKDLRIQAARVLGAIGADSAEVISELTRVALDDQEDWDVRLATAMVLASIEPVTDDGIVALLGKALENSDAEIRTSAIRALRSSSADVESFVPAIRAIADNPEEHGSGDAQVILNRLERARALEKEYDLIDQLH